MAAPETQACKVFVGNLSNEVDELQIRERFKSYGVIQSVRILKGFGFVEYTSQDQAQAAIQGENGKTLAGRNIDVKTAVRKNPQQPQQETATPPNQDQAENQQQDNNQGPSKQYLDRREQYQNWEQQQHKDFGYDNNRGGRGGRGPRGGPMRGRGGRGRGRGGGPYPHHDGDGYHQHQHHHQRSHAPPAPMVYVGEKVNDCEIVCVNKMNRHYAESIELRLKNLGMNIDVLFPNPEIPLGKILGNISSRGVMYAILVTPLNEEHRSLTLNVLQGQQQEHRNMPLDDAMSLIAKTFEATIDMKVKTGGSGPGDKHPEDIMAVLGFLTENRPLSVMEYDKIIKYLAQKREQMLRMEYGDNIPSTLATPPIGPPVDPAVKAKQEELQNKIFGILDKQKEINQPTGAGSSSVVPPPAINASLQKAIDSLIKTGPNLLNQASAAAGQKPQEPAQQQQGYGGGDYGYGSYGSTQPSAAGPPTNPLYGGGY